MASLSSTQDETYESLCLVKPEVNVYIIPPRQSTTRKHRAADWKLDSPNFICRLKILAKGERCLIRLEDRQTGAHFATCPVESYPSVAVESVEDSTRYFVIRVQNDNGQLAFLGIGFADRSDSFDFNVALQDHFKHLKYGKPIETHPSAEKPATEGETPIKHDWSFKEGQTIRINLKSSLAAEDHPKKTVKTNHPNSVPGILPPPPSSSSAASPSRQPPPSATTAPTTSSAGNHSESNWIQF